MFLSRKSEHLDTTPRPEEKRATRNKEGTIKTNSDMPKGEPREIRLRLKKRRRVQAVLGVAGGIILFVLGASGSISFYERIISLVIQYGIISSEYKDAALKILEVLGYLAMGGGLTVIIGALLIPKVRRLGNWLIGIGAGVSLMSFLTKIFFLGPIIQQYVSQATQDMSYLLKAIHLLGIEIGLLGLGIILAFLATFEVYRWTIILGASSFLCMLAGISGDPRLLILIRTILSIPPEYAPYVDRILIILIMYIGPLLLIVSLLAGAGYIRISKILVALSLISMILPTVSAFLDLSTVKNYLGFYAILQYVRLVSVIGVYVGGIYFIKKA